MEQPEIVYEVRGDFSDTELEDDQQAQKEAIITSIRTDCEALLNPKRFIIVDEDYDDSECRLVFQPIKERLIETL